MKAVIVKSWGKVENLQLVEDYPINELEDTFVTVQIKSIGFNPVDFKIRQGKFGGDIPPQGTILGADFAGIVTKVGSKVQRFKNGDEVYGMAIGPVATNGTYAEYINISEHFIGIKPSNISFDDAAASVIPGLTALQCFEKIKRGLPDANGKTIFIGGASGGVGTFAIQFARLAGFKILATAGSEESSKYVQSLGVSKENIIPYRGLSIEQIREKILASNNNQPVEATLDLVGEDIKRVCFISIKFDGQVTSIVEEDDPHTIVPLYPSLYPTFNLFNLSGTFNYIFVGGRAFQGREEWPQIGKDIDALSSLLTQGKLKAPAVQNLGNLSAESVQQAHRLLEERHVQGKLVVSV